MQTGKNPNNGLLVTDPRPRMQPGPSQTGVSSLQTQCLGGDMREPGGHSDLLSHEETAADVPCEEKDIINASASVMWQNIIARIACDNDREAVWLAV